MMNYLDCYTPVRLDINPLVDINIFEELGTIRYSKLPKDILKPSLLDILDNANLPILNVIVWQWNLKVDQLNPPHTDGDLRNNKIARAAGLNWLIEGDSALDFWNKDKLVPYYEEQPDIFYTAWSNQNNLLPEVTCTSFPAIVNPQIPHRVRSINGSTIRKSIVIYFKDNVPYEETRNRLSNYHDFII